MENFDENKGQSNINIHLGISKSQALKLFFKEYKLISFLLVVYLILFTLLGVKSKNIALMMQMQGIDLFIVLVYFVFAFINVATHSWQLTMQDSTVCVKMFFRKCIFDIRELVNVKVDYERSDNQSPVMTYDSDLGYYHEDYFLETMSKIIKIETELIVICVEFLGRQGIEKFKLPYSKIKRINNRERVYQYTSDEDLSTLFWLLNSKDDLYK